MNQSWKQICKTSVKINMIYLLYSYSINFSWSFLSTTCSFFMYMFFFKYWCLKKTCSNHVQFWSIYLKCNSYLFECTFYVGCTNISKRTLFNIIFFLGGGVHVLINVLIVLFYLIYLFKTHARDKIPCDIKTNITE